jgi:hypothetical protein
MSEDLAPVWSSSCHHAVRWFSLDLTWLVNNITFKSTILEDFVSLKGKKGINDTLQMKSCVSMTNKLWRMQEKKPASINLVGLRKTDFSPTVDIQANISSSDFQHWKQQCYQQHSNVCDPVPVAWHICKCESRNEYFSNKCIPDFPWKNEGKKHSTDIEINGKIILQWILREIVGEVG